MAWRDCALRSAMARPSGHSPAVYSSLLTHSLRDRDRLPVGLLVLDLLNPPAHRRIRHDLHPSPVLSLLRHLLGRFWQFGGRRRGATRLGRGLR